MVQILKGSPTLMGLMVFNGLNCFSGLNEGERGGKFKKMEGASQEGRLSYSVDQV